LVNDDDDDDDQQPWKQPSMILAEDIVSLLPLKFKSVFYRLLKTDLYRCGVGLGVPLSRFLDRAPYKVLNE